MGRKKSFEQWIQREVIRGDNNGDVMPDKLITKAELLTIINRILGYTDMAAMQFEDVVSDKWYAEDMLIARSAGFFLMVLILIRLILKVR